MQTRTLLFFTCFSDRSITLESTILHFAEKGYKVFFMTTCARGLIHQELENKGIEIYVMEAGSPGKLFYYPKAVNYLIRFCKTKKVDFLHAHLQIPNLLASLAGWFMKTKVLTVRHNSDVIYLSGTRKERLVEWAINRLSKCIIAISDKVRSQLIEQEQVCPGKVHRINNGYDFEQYNQLSKGEDLPDRIRRQYPCDLLMVSPGRLIRTKRHDLTIRAVQELAAKGFQIKLLILGDGPEAGRLRELVVRLDIGEHVFMPGYCENITDYIKASDMVVLLSESEASNNAVKEAGFFERVVVACHQVGDFDDYIENGKNGFLVSRERALEELVAVVTKTIAAPGQYVQMGKALKKKVVEEFDVKTVCLQYEQLQEELIAKK
jgi:glycosyltransferase involved in cell wall biosynthesis